MRTVRTTPVVVAALAVLAGVADADITLLSENFDSMGPSGTAPPSGWVIGHMNPVRNRDSTGGEGAAIVSEALIVDNGTAQGSSNGESYNYGTTGAADRAIGNIPRTTNGDHVMQVAITNNTGTSLSVFTLSYWGEQWHRGESKAATKPEKLRVYFSSTSATSGFVRMTGFDFIAPQDVPGEAQTALDGNAAANRAYVTGTYTPAAPIANGATFYIRWYDYNDDATLDHGLAIDDVTVTTPGLAVNTLDATGILPTTATLNGELPFLGGEPQVQVYFNWGTAPGSLTRTTTPQTMTAPGSFNAPLAGLTPGVEYWFQAVAQGSSQPVRGAVLSFVYASNYGLRFNGSNSQIAMGVAPGLGAATFTLEVWFKRTGPGQTTGSGTGGIVAVPLVTKGRSEGDGSNIDCNYFLGISDSGVIAADFEDMTSGGNHPVWGVTTIQNEVWYHAAATYDGTTWRLYLNGLLESTTVANATPRYDSIQHFGLGTAFNSAGAAAGRFEGVLDEPRVWNYARSLAELRSTINTNVTSATGLLGRWGLNEGAGTTADDSSSGGNHGIVSNGAWTLGAPFDVNFPPDSPVIVAPPDGGNVRIPSTPLTVRVADPEADALQVKFYGRLAGGPPATPFRIIALPDTQFYSESYPATFRAQTQWIVNNAAAMNIVYVAHEGDLTNDASVTAQWDNANSALSTLDTIPSLVYGLTVGNHDQSPHGTPGGTANFNAYFPYTRYASRPWYGGHYGTNNDNHYVLFSASGMDFIAIHMAYDPSANASVLSWAAGLLQAYPNRRAIVTSHYILDLGTPGTFGTQGAAIYNALKVYPNLFLMLCGHNHGEAQRYDVCNGKTVYTLLADYQTRSNGGDGWLRILEFVPAADRINVKTYSPTLNQYETDADSQFTLVYDMEGVPFQELGTLDGVASGSDATFVWTGLAAGRAYEWYATASDAHIAPVMSPQWSFTAVTTPADLDRDGDVDLSDFALFQLCFNGPNQAPGNHCAVDSDFNDDNDVDLADFAVFQACFNGPNRVPACEGE